MDIHSCIQKDHFLIRRIFEQIEHCTEDEYETRQQYANVLACELLCHHHAEETVYYRLLLGYSITKQAAEHAFLDHRFDEELLSKLNNPALSYASWMQAFRQLRDSVEMHMRIEELTLIPLARVVLNRHQREALTSEMLKEKEEAERKLASSYLHSQTG